MVDGVCVCVSAFGACGALCQIYGSADSPHLRAKQGKGREQCEKENRG